MDNRTSFFIKDILQDAPSKKQELTESAQNKTKDECGMY